MTRLTDSLRSQIDVHILGMLESDVKNGKKSNILRESVQSEFEISFSNDQINQTLKRLSEANKVRISNGEEKYSRDEWDEVPDRKAGALSWVLADYYVGETSEEQFIAMSLVKRFLWYLIQPSKRQAFERIMKTSEELIPREAKKRANAWVTAVRIESRYPNIYPDDRAMQKERDHRDSTIIDALYKNEGFEAKYDFEQDTELFYPLRLVRRENISYIECQKNSNKEIKLYALHRFGFVKRADRARPNVIETEPVPGVDYSPRIHEEVEIIITGPSCAHFYHARYARPDNNDHQVSSSPLEQVGDKVTRLRITMTNVTVDYQLKAWMLGLGSHLMVTRPEELRDELETELALALENYRARNA
jgi:hypothetical protein